MIKTKNIPNLPGCYIYKDSDSNIIYVGKAKDLKKRVSSYFSKKDHDPKTAAMISHISNIDFIATSNEVEALILENNLIKKHSPKYNIDLKDAKRYASLEITNEKFPKLIVSRKNKSNGRLRTSSSADAKGKLYGPFVSAQARDYIRYLLNKTFKLRTCKNFPKKPCLRYHMNICDAPCIGNIENKEYLEKVQAVESILSGKTRMLEKTLKEKMKKYSKKEEYEKANEVKNQLEAIIWLKEKQKMERNKKYDEDIINFEIREDRVYLMNFNIYKGTLENKNEFVFDFKPDFLDEFLVQYYSENKVPKKIILPKKIGDDILEFLNKKRKKKVEVIIPKQGELKELLDLVAKNIEISFFGDSEKLIALQKELGLNEIPNVIECFDISHLSGTDMVASMVQFRNGRADKNNYRKFKIKTVEGIDDFAAIGEVVGRRYYGIQKRKEEYPNLILIDGGEIQLEFALRELKKLGLNIPTISLAKREEEIYLPNRKILRLGGKNKARLFLQQIRDEAHRFAINYNRLLRKKRFEE